MTILVRKVETARDKERFIRFPWKIYAGDRNWVPPLLLERRSFLDPRKNPFFDHSEVCLFTALDTGGDEAGRIAAIVNHNHVTTHNEKAGFFGLFECLDKPEAAGRLFEAAADFLRTHGLTVMRGPENMCVNDDLGLLIKGFDSPPAFMMPYNPPYYEKLMESFGFVKCMDLFAYHGVNKGIIPDRLKRGTELAMRRYEMTIRAIDMKNFDREVLLIRDIYNQAWEQNWGAVATTDREFQYVAKDLKQVLDPNLCLIAEVGGKTAGFSLALPDFNQVLIHLNGRLFPLAFLKLLYYRRKSTASASSLWAFSKSTGGWDSTQHSSTRHMSAREREGSFRVRCRGSSKTTLQ